MPTGDHMAALRIRLADGWKTYWRSAGRGGDSRPVLNWQGSGNLAARPLSTGLCQRCFDARLEC